ncbi:MAG: hypothetical protein IPM24_21820 [Bryobacterales bacterium]|nr:hypothetical protein [Bryobacterales bacterium]
MVAASIVLSALVPLAAAWGFGSLVTAGRRVPFVVSLGVGAVIESTAVFLLLAAGIANAWTLGAVAAGGIALLFRWRAMPLALPALDPVTRGLFAAVLAAYGGLYFIHGLAPEIQPDGLTYHLGIVADYARSGALHAHPGFFEMLPQGMEMLYLVAFVFGKHSAAKLVHLAFLLATPPLMLTIGTKLGLPSYVPPAAALLYFATPIVGLNGASSYNDAALVFFVLGAAYLLLEERWALAGLCGGFCFAIKYSGALYPAAALLGLIALRRWRGAISFAAAAAFVAAPWIVRNAIVTGNPLAPMFNAWFPNPYFHAASEALLRTNWRLYYEGFRLAEAPWQLTLGGKLQGIYGPFFWIAPLALWALRKSHGRWLWLAAAVCAVPWFSNHGARFLMPALPFLTMALALTLPRPAVWAAVAAHAVLSWPAVLALYEQPHTWRLKETPFAAAFRSESEHAYLSRLEEYQIADMVRESTQPGDTIYFLMDAARAYLDRPVVEYWQSTLGERLLDTLKVASHYARADFYDVRGQWSPRDITGLRFRLKDAHPGEWCIHDVRVESGEDRIFNSPQWQLRGWPNPWELPAALDQNIASRWRSWEPMQIGMYAEIVFDRPQRTTGAVFASHTPVYGVGFEIYGRDLAGEWKTLAPEAGVEERVALEMRPAAARYLRSNGIRYVLAPTEYGGAWQVGRPLVEHAPLWGFEKVNERGSFVLLEVPE